MDMHEVFFWKEAPPAPCLLEGWRHALSCFSEPGVSTGNASQPVKKIQHGGVEFLRLLNVRHVMSLGNRHSLGPHDISFEFVCINALAA